MRGYRTDRWLTRSNQARKASEHIRKGEQSTLAVLYKPMSKEAQDEHGEVVRDEQGNIKMVQFALLRTHCLFNIEQTEGLASEPEDTGDAEAVAPSSTMGQPSESWRYRVRASNIALGLAREGSEYLMTLQDQGSAKPLHQFTA